MFEKLVLFSEFHILYNSNSHIDELYVNKTILPIITRLDYQAVYINKLKKQNHLVNKHSSQLIVELYQKQ